MMTVRSVYRTDSAPLFGPRSPARDAVDRRAMAAAEGAGILAVNGLPETIPLEADKRKTGAASKGDGSGARPPRTQSADRSATAMPCRQHRQA